MDKKPKYTPGPWVVTPDGYRVMPDDPLADKVIAYTALNNEERREEARANAKLIASAPALLHALVGAPPALGVHDADECMIWYRTICLPLLASLGCEPK